MTTIHEQRFALELGESRKLQIRSSDAAIAGRNDEIQRVGHRYRRQKLLCIPRGAVNLQNEVAGVNGIAWPPLVVIGHQTLLNPFDLQGGVTVVADVQADFPDVRVLSYSDKQLAIFPSLRESTLGGSKMIESLVYWHQLHLRRAAQALPVLPEQGVVLKDMPTCTPPPETDLRCKPASHSPCSSVQQQNSAAMPGQPGD
eukprot:CAMPEP_0177156178 /NCGR_PEP_ID=MMETSP0367-20130122/2584_1 /TAXON_ID=447022 ORGANISM="Scrippsiella hangoei-like, Strain SHHI-4" /NCGR_SAMPLE_ID=MMETSP0367 /ASSEMBLY_ACC=CAM_ASM_000362 /LENGTH=199 /DNA_ID=CAMNT_0018601607 /DNA_START=134 /DNA_END=731 /DNA_ORIENTATION=+